MRAYADVSSGTNVQEGVKQCNKILESNAVLTALDLKTAALRPQDKIPGMLEKCRCIECTSQCAATKFLITSFAERNAGCRQWRPGQACAPCSSATTRQKSARRRPSMPMPSRCSSGWWSRRRIRPGQASGASTHFCTRACRNDACLPSLHECMAARQMHATRPIAASLTRRANALTQAPAPRCCGAPPSCLRMCERCCWYRGCPRPSASSMSPCCAHTCSARPPTAPAPSRRTHKVSFKCQALPVNMHAKFLHLKNRPHTAVV